MSEDDVKRLWQAQSFPLPQRSAEDLLAEAAGSLGAGSQTHRTAPTRDEPHKRHKYDA
jgi:hypothetical protein